jgi:hypothetical protein
MDYEARRRAMDREYEEAWEQLSPAMREKLARVGIDGPDLMEEPARDLCREDDAEALFRNSTKLSTLADMAGEVDRLPWLMREAFGISEEQSEKIAVWHREAVQYEVKR